MLVDVDGIDPSVLSICEQIPVTRYSEEAPLARMDRLGVELRLCAVDS